MIILTEAEALKVIGISPSQRNAALNPIPLKDGTFMLNESVLSDPAHSDVRTFLSGLPKKTVLESNTYKEGEDGTKNYVTYPEPLADYKTNRDPDRVKISLPAEGKK